jgi:hypothetical protein
VDEGTEIALAPSRKEWATVRALAWALAALAGCGIRTMPLTVQQAPASTSATRFYKVEEVIFEAPSAWKPLVNGNRLAVAGVGACEDRKHWERPTTAMEGVFRESVHGNCPVMWLAPVQHLDLEECAQEEAVTDRFRGLATSSEIERSRLRVGGRQAWGFHARVAQDNPGERKIYVICGPSRAWMLGVWIPRDAATEGAAAHDLLLRTVEFQTVPAGSPSAG